MKKNEIIQIGALSCVLLLWISFFTHASIFYILLLLIMLTILSFIIFFDIRRSNSLIDFMADKSKRKSKHLVEWEEEEQEKLQLLRKRVELTALQSQINPHFLYNTLDSIRSRALIDGQKEIASMTEILSKFFRYCISHDENLVKIREELNHIDDYYYIQKYRFEDRLQLEIELESEDIKDFYIPKMTLQPLVENAMVHGLEKLTRIGIVTIKMIQTEQKIVITISDNGAGMRIEQLVSLNERMNSDFLDVGMSGKRHSGIALTNVNARIKITFGEDYGIHYRSLEGMGTDAIITIPKVDDFKRVKYGTLF